MYKPSWKALNWQNILFMGSTHLVALIGVPYYISIHGLDLWDVTFFLFFFWASGLGTTVGYHRLFAHRTFQAGREVTFLGLFFGASAFEMSALEWASQHRDHHRFVDTEKDPYSIKKGFWYAHMGWLLFWKHHFHLENVEDLKQNPLIVHQHKYYLLWSITAGILMPLLLGYWTHHLLGALILSICARVTVVYQGTFCINSLCHLFGKATYDIFASAKDHWFIALFTWGEGYHNFHHHFPSDYRNGIRWFHWDPSKWTILIFRMFGLVSDLKKATRFQILNSIIKAENLRMSLTPPILLSSSTLDVLKQKYDRTLQHLRQWEEEFKRQQRLKAEQMTSQFAAKLARLNVRKAKSEFRHAYREWNFLMRCYVKGIEVQLNAV